MASQDIKRKFELVGETSGAIRAVDDFTKHVNKAETALKDATKEGKQLGSALEDAIKSNRLYELSESADISRVALAKMRAELVKIGATDDEIEKVARSIQRNYRNAIQGATQDTKKLSAAAEGASDAARRYDDAFTKASFRSAAFGDIDTSIGTVRSLADTLSPGSGAGLTVAQDLFAAREGLERLGPGLKFLGESAAQGTGIVGGLATAIAGAVPGISGAALGFSVLAIAAAPFALALAGLAVSFKKASDEAAIANAAAEKFFKERQAEAEINLSDITTEDAKKRLEILKQSEQDQTSIVQDSNAIRQQTWDEALEQANKSFGILGDASARLSYSFFEGRGGFNEFNEGVTTAKESVGDAAAEIHALELALKDGTIAENDRAKAIEEAQKDLDKAEQELSQTREKHTLAIEQLNAQEEQAFADYLKRQRETSASRVTADNREREDRNLALQRKQADLDAELAKQAEAFEAQQTAIAERGAAAILAIRDDLAKREADALTKIADLRAKAAADDQKALLKYQKERARAEEDFRRNQDRARESYEQTQLDAILNNDVAAFLSNRTEFRTNRRRNREDFRTEGGRAFEDYEEERAARQAALEARIAEINTELEAYRAAQLAKIAEIEIQTAKELELNQLAYDEKLRLDADARKITNEREAEDLRIRAERRSADRILEDQKASEALASTLAKIDTQRIAQNAALDAAIMKAQQFKAVIDSIAFSGGGGVYTGSGGSQLGRITPFASGVDYLPTNMRIDAHAGERILSRAQNATFTSYMQRAMGGGSGMGQRPIVNLNVQSTNIAGVEYVTVTEMNRVVNTAIDELATDWQTAASVPV